MSHKIRSENVTYIQTKNLRNPNKEQDNFQYYQPNKIG